MTKNHDTTHQLGTAKNKVALKNKWPFHGFLPSLRTFKSQRQAEVKIQLPTFFVKRGGMPTSEASLLSYLVVIARLSKSAVFTEGDFSASATFGRCLWQSRFEPVQE